MPDGGKLTIETANAYLDHAYVGAFSEPVEPGQYVMIARRCDCCDRSVRGPDDDVRSVVCLPGRWPRTSAAVVVVAAE